MSLSQGSISLDRLVFLALVCKLLEFGKDEKDQFLAYEQTSKWVHQVGLHLELSLTSLPVFGALYVEFWGREGGSGLR